MASQHSRKYNPIQQWRTRDRDVTPNGYVIIKVPEHPKAFRGGWYYEHILVAERSLGRMIHSYETVHHINEVKYDNHEDNLFVCTREEHDRAHALTLAVA